MSDQPQKKSSEEQKTYEEMPSIEEFKKLGPDDQKELINKFGVPNDEPDEESQPSEEESKEDADQPSEDDKGSESDNKDTQNKTAGEDETELAKKYKSLEAEFTRRSQRLKQMEEKLESLSQENKGKETEVKRPLDKLAADNPKAKDLIDAFKEELDLHTKREVAKEIKPLQDTLTQQQAEKNYGTFQKEVNEFLASPLGKMEAEFNAVAAEFYENQDALRAAAAEDPALFKHLKKEVLARHFEKAASLVSKTDSPEERNKKIKSTGVSGKSKTTVEQDDQLALKSFKKLSSKEMKNVLAQHGAVKN